MNLILVDENDFVAPLRVRLSGRRQEHIERVLGASEGDRLDVGMINGRIGQGTIVFMDSAGIEMKTVFEHDPPPPLPLTLILALPRPKMLKRILRTITCLGVKQLYLINSWRVEKGFWSSPVLDAEALKEQMLPGLEQAKDTLVPQVHLRRFFKSFVLDELPELAKGTLALTAHPGGLHQCPRNPGTAVTLVLGPEGGFIPLEIETFEKIGFTTITLGPRILRLEIAVPFILSRLY